MADYNYYNPDYHKGDLPVRVLVDGFLEWFINTSPEFKQRFDSEVKYHGLNKSISYIMIKGPIRETARISPDGKIELYENFLQYLWCLCYVFPILYDENIGKQLKEGNPIKSVRNERTTKAIHVLSPGLGLTKGYANADEVFFNRPNPERFNEVDKADIGMANAICVAAIDFVLIHEFAHKWYGHLEYEPTNDESKKDELDADDFAISEIAYNFKSEKGITSKNGIIIGLISLLFLDKSLSGGNLHPDFDIRLTKALEKLELDNMDPIWGATSFMLLSWFLIYNYDNIPITFSPYFDSENLKQTYFNTLNALKYAN